MKCRATIKLKIPKKKELLTIFASYLDACQYAADMALKKKIKNKFSLHHLVYKNIRKKFNLKAQFAINSIAKGFEAYKGCKKKVVFKHAPVRYDRRTFSFTKDKVRLTVNEGRINVPITIPEYYRKYLSWSYQTADLFLDRKKRLMLHVTFAKDIASKTGSDSVVGVDLGINNLAVCSNGKVFKGEKTMIKQFQYLRRRLRAKGTKSSRRLLRNISGRQKRYMAWVNHNVSKEIVSSAGTIVLENLKGIRKRRNKHMGKRMNRWLNGWSFYQLQSFIRYKAEQKGKRVIFVNPYMTSQICSACGTKGSRFFDSFSCQHCGFSSQSDFNASCNLRRLHVTQPDGSYDDSKAKMLGNAEEYRAKSPAFY